MAKKDGNAPAVSSTITLAATDGESVEHRAVLDKPYDAIEVRNSTDQDVVAVVDTGNGAGGSYFEEKIGDGLDLRGTDVGDYLNLRLRNVDDGDYTVALKQLSGNLRITVS